MTHETKLAIRIPSKIKARVKREARRRYVTESSIVREAILQHLAAHEPKAKAA
jgi:predicted DNA-binding protein